jgi:maleate isomerase
MSAERSGLDDRLRIGVLVPSSNTVMENDLHQALPKSRYTVHTARMYLEETTAAAERKMVEEFAAAAAEQLKTLYPHLLVFGCTSAGSLGGPSYDREVCHRLGELAGCPGMGVISSVAEALDRRGLRRLAILTPYVEELTDSVGQSLEGQGFEVVTACGMGIDVNFELAHPSPSDIVQFAKESLNGIEAEGVFVSCTNFRAFEALPMLEEALSLPVVTSNSAVLEAIEQFASQQFASRRFASRQFASQRGPRS